MANTYTSFHYHFTFSTKNREPWIVPKIENRVWAYIGGVARKHKMTAVQIGGVEDHIRALVLAPPTIAPNQIAQYLKGDSSKWIHEEFPKMRSFEWQDGYGGFTVSKSQSYRRDRIPQESARTSPEENLSGRISGVVEEA